jgi:hypothetical protein
MHACGTSTPRSLDAGENIKALSPYLAPLIDGKPTGEGLFMPKIGK